MLRISAALVLFLFAAFGVHAQNELTIKPSTVDKQLLEKFEADPGTPISELARLGNQLAETSGYSFNFAPENVEDTGDRVTYKLKGTDGRDRTFVAPVPGDHPCGIVTEFPVVGARKNVLSVFVEGRVFDVVMPKSFIVDEVELVDSSLRRTLRTWVVPMDRTPEAISVDGTRLYLNSYVDGLFLEVNAQGRYRYVAKDRRLMLTRWIDLKKFPRDKDNAYLGFRRFSAGKKSYTLKFSHPCT
jgi:hypothetical protein